MIKIDEPIDYTDLDQIVPLYNELVLLEIKKNSILKNPDKEVNVLEYVLLAHTLKSITDKQTECIGHISKLLEYNFAGCWILNK